MAKKYGMVIDMAKCVGCSACAIACKTEHNTRIEDVENGRKYNWADFHNSTKGKFPDTKFIALPVLCNHCSDAPCVEACPVVPDAKGRKAMFKTENGITMLDHARCIGCQRCIDACPYSDKDVNKENKQYSVISYNPAGSSSQPFWGNSSAVIPTMTSTPAALAVASQKQIPFHHEYSHPFTRDIRPSNVSEKCNFCEHRLMQGDKPYCVVSCPTDARIFGDQNDPDSEIFKLLATKRKYCLKNNNGEFLDVNEKGTRPNVFYINLKEHGNVANPGPEIPTTEITVTRVYPVPTRDKVTIEFELNRVSSMMFVSIFSTDGKLMKQFEDKQNRLLGVQRLQIDLTGLASGTYLCSLKTLDGRMKTVNIVVIN